MVKPSRDLHKLLHTKVELRCEAVGNPAPAYEWYQHTMDGEVRRGTSKNLVLANLRYDDQGDYECRATNTIRGKLVSAANTQHIKLNVSGAPVTPEKLSRVSVVRGTDALVRVEFCADPAPKLTWQLGGLEGGQSSVILNTGTQHDRFMVLAEEAGSQEDCYLSTLRIAAADLSDTREYVLNLDNSHGHHEHRVHVSVREALALHTLVGGVVGGVLTLVVLVGALCCCRRACCPGSKPLKQDMERWVMAPLARMDHTPIIASLHETICCRTVVLSFCPPTKLSSFSTFCLPWFLVCFPLQPRRLEQPERRFDQHRRLEFCR